MSSQWRVTQGDNQFSVESLDKLAEMARKGTVEAGDMIQPPGASDWIYALEIEQLASIFPDDDSEELDYKPGGAMKSVLPLVTLGFLMLVIVAGSISIAVLIQYLPDGDERLIGDGGLSYSQMLVVSEGMTLQSEPEGDAKAFAGVSVPKDSILELLARRGDFYKAQTQSGETGWIPVNAVIPMYTLGNDRVQAKYDPLYNPARYVNVVNASWMEMPNPDPKAPETDEKITIFHFMFSNTAGYDMTDLRIAATIKDAKGSTIDTVEIAVEGVIPANGKTMVGTLKPAADDEEGGLKMLTQHTFEKMSINVPELQERWSAGLEVPMTVADFDNANVDIVELRAIPDDEAKKDVRR